MSGHYFLAKVYAVLTDRGVDTSEMTNDQAVQKFNELNGKEGIYSVETGEQKQNKKKNMPPRKGKYLILVRQEYAAVCSAIITEYGNKIPAHGRKFYNNFCYFFDYDKKTCEIRFKMILDIEHDREILEYWESKNDKR